MRPDYRSAKVRSMGIKRCQLCNRVGHAKSMLTIHHCDGAPRNNDPDNLLVVHRILCHTFADFVTQFYAMYKVSATPTIIKQAWREFHWNGRGMVFGEET